MKISLKFNPLIEKASEEVMYSILESSDLSVSESSTVLDTQQQPLANSTLIAATSNRSENGEDKIVTFIRESRQSGMNIIIIYALLYFIGSFGNIFVLANLLRARYRSKMNFYIRQLAIADLIVINFTILTDILWRITVRWEAGHFGCKIVQMMRIFGLYLTSMVVICITIDRFFAFVFPLSVLKSKERNRYLLILAYAISIVSSVPNAFVFHLEEHPKMKGFHQCLTRNYFDAQWKEIFYNMSTLVIMYIIPLVFIIFCYATILRNIAKTTKEDVTPERQQLKSPTGNESVNVKCKRRAKRCKDTPKFNEGCTAITKSHTDTRVNGSIDSFTQGKRCKLIDRLNGCFHKQVRRTNNLNTNQVTDVAKTRNTRAIEESESINQLNLELMPSAKSLSSLDPRRAECTTLTSSSTFTSFSCSQTNAAATHPSFTIGHSLHPHAEGNFVTLFEHRPIDEHKCSNKSTRAIQGEYHSNSIGNNNDEDENIKDTAAAKANALQDEQDGHGDNYFDNEATVTFECSDDELSPNDQRGQQSQNREQLKANCSSEQHKLKDESFIINGQIHFTDSTKSPSQPATPEKVERNISSKSLSVNNKQIDESIEENENDSPNNSSKLKYLHSPGQEGQSSKASTRELVKFTTRNKSTELNVNLKKNKSRKKSLLSCKNLPLASHQSIQSEKRAAIMARAKRKTLRMSIAIVATFCICWTPYSLMLLLEVCGKSFVGSYVTKEVKDILYLCAVGNSVLNPFVHSYHIFLDFFVAKRKWIISKIRAKNLVNRNTPTERTQHIEDSSKHFNLKSKEEISNVQSKVTTNHRVNCDHQNELTVTATIANN